MMEGTGSDTLRLQRKIMYVLPFATGNTLRALLLHIQYLWIIILAQLYVFTVHSACHGVTRKCGVAYQ